MDIFVPFHMVPWNGQQYFMMFIEDFSRYSYIYHLHKNSQYLDTYSKILRLKLRTNSAKALKALNLTVLINTTNMMGPVNNVLGYLLNAKRNVVLSYNILCQICPL